MPPPPCPALQEEGVKGLWRGNSINVMRIAPQGALPHTPSPRP